MIRFAGTLLALMFLSTVVALGDDPPVPVPAKPSLIFPAFPVEPITPAPGPAPVKPIDVDAVPVLTAGQWYVVQSETEFFLIASPVGKVVIQYEQGPLRAKGVFADGNGKVETRTYSAKYLAIVDVVAGASGRVELFGIPAGLTDEASITRRLVDIGAAPQPPPKPDEPVEPVTIQSRVRKALVGDTAHADAVALAGSAAAIIAKLETLKDNAEVQDVFVAMLTANKWTKGKYPAIQDLLNEHIPPGDAFPLDGIERHRIKNFFLDVEQGAKEALK